MDGEAKSRNGEERRGWQVCRAMLHIFHDFKIREFHLSAMMRDAAPRSVFISFNGDCTLSTRTAAFVLFGSNFTFAPKIISSFKNLTKSVFVKAEITALARQKSKSFFFRAL